MDVPRKPLYGCYNDELVSVDWLVVLIVIKYPSFY